VLKVAISAKQNPSQHPFPELSGEGVLWVGKFQAMASECQILFEGIEQKQAEALLRLACCETWRIEHKYSRYRCDNIMHKINHSEGKTITLDNETSALLNFADQCYQLSKGLFDISSGVLRKVWRFDGSDKIATEQEIETVMPFIGWQKVHWQAPSLRLLKGMQLDLGGLGKEYAVDKVTQLLSTHRDAQGTAFLINFGGDLACSGPRLNGAPWTVAVESIKVATEPTRPRVSACVSLTKGAIATSGDSRRYLLKEGIRYSHILNPKSGQPVIGAPHSISVAAENCMQAGMLSTLAMLQGIDAEEFLNAQGVQFWVQR
jgi:thiamine biosynthesis lipoprotein